MTSSDDRDEAEREQAKAFVVELKRRIGPTALNLDVDAFAKALPQVGMGGAEIDFLGYLPGLDTSTGPSADEVREAMMSFGASMFALGHAAGRGKATRAAANKAAVVEAIKPAIARLRDRNGGCEPTNNDLALEIKRTAAWPGTPLSEDRIGRILAKERPLAKARPLQPRRP